jgi:hypothetical protein
MFNFFLPWKKTGMLNNYVNKYYNSNLQDGKCIKRTTAKISVVLLSSYVKSWITLTTWNGLTKGNKT